MVLARHESRLAAVAGPVRRLELLVVLPALIGAGPVQVIDGDTIDLAGERIRLIWNRRAGGQSDLPTQRPRMGVP
jgi:endonuclease YncB( thermonuclease family)